MLATKVGKKRQIFQVPEGRLADIEGGKKIHHASEGERDTSHMKSQVQWLLAISPTGSGVAGGRLEM